MGYIPHDAKWYLADIVLEFKIEGEDNIVHTNTILVRADSPEEAFAKAIVLGEGSNMNTWAQQARLW